MNASSPQKQPSNYTFPRNIVCNRYGEVRSGLSIPLAFAAIFIGSFVLSVSIQTVFQLMGKLPIGPASSLLLYVNYIVMIAMLLFLWKVVFRRPVSHIGLVRRNWLPELCYGLLFGAISISLAYLLLVVTGSVQIVAVVPSYLWSPSFLNRVIHFIFVGFFEEILSRGYIMSALRTTRNQLVIVVLPALCFGLLHYFNDEFSLFPMINISLVGLLFAYQFIRSGKLWIPIGYHITWNLLQGAIFGLEVSGNQPDGSLLVSKVVGPQWWTGAAFGPEGGAVATIAIVAGIAWVHFFIKPDQGEDCWRWQLPVSDPQQP